MAQRRPLVHINGMPTEMPSTDTLYTGSAIVRMERFVVSFYGTNVATVPGGYTPGGLLVGINGAWLSTPNYTATDGSIVIFAEALKAGDEVTFAVFTITTLTNDALVSYTVSTLPSAANSARCIRWCSDMQGRPGPIYSDGTNWRRLSDDSVVT